MKRVVVFAGALVTLSGASFFACSSSDGTDPADAGDDGAVTDDASGTDATTDDGSFDSGSDTGSTSDSGGDGALDAGVDSASPCWFVDPSGSDSNDGGQASPYRTITRALGQASDAGDGGPGCIRVRPGTYSPDAGEVFPLVIPPSTALLGDEANKGNGTTPTKIVGDLGVGVSTIPYASGVRGRAGSTFAGFYVTLTGSGFAFGYFANEDGTIVRNNSFIGCSLPNAVRFEGSSFNWIAGNVIEGNSNVGLIFRPISKGNRIENNTVRLNSYGIEFDDTTASDLGGGDAGSTGGNTVSCNTTNDVWTNDGAFTMPAVGNRWDHVPPTSGLSGAGVDTRAPAGGTFLTDGGTLAPDACP